LGIALLESCLSLRPASRPSAAEALAHPFFTAEEPRVPTQGEAAAMLAALYGGREMHELNARKLRRPQKHGGQEQQEQC
jgi:serine/threonine protein kinase